MFLKKNPSPTTTLLEKKHIKALKLMHFLSLSLGARVFVAVLYSLAAQLLQFRGKNSKKKKQEQLALCNFQDSA